MEEKIGGSFLIEETNYQNIFIIEDFDETSKQMIDATREFVEKEICPNIRELEQSLSDKIGLSVVIKNNSQNKGTITLSYKEIDQLNKIIEIIKSYY